MSDSMDAAPARRRRRQVVDTDTWVNTGRKWSMWAKEGLPECAQCWLTYSGVDLPINRELFSLASVTSSRVVGEPPWLSQSDAKPKEMLLCPVFLTRDVYLGRVHGSIVATTEEMSWLGNVKEERVCIVFHDGLPCGYYSVLYDTDFVVTYKKDVQRMLSGEQLNMFIFHRSSPDYVAETVSHSEKLVCSFCTAKGVECECRAGDTANIDLSVLYKSNVREANPAVFWQSFIRLFASLHKGTRSSQFFSAHKNNNLYPPGFQQSVQVEYDFTLDPDVLLSRVTDHLQHLFSSKGVARLMKQSKRKMITYNAFASDCSSDNLSEDNKNHPCPHCSSCFSRKHDVQRHILSVHNTEKDFRCDECDSTFALKQYLAVHKKDVHSSKNYPCLICKRKFPTKQKVVRHVKIVHYRMRPYQCPLCPTSTYCQRSDLRRHFRLKHPSVVIDDAVLCTPRDLNPQDIPRDTLPDFPLTEDTLAWINSDDFLAEVEQSF